MSLNGNERAAIIGQLVALRNVLDGVLASLQEAEEPACLHSEEYRKYEGHMGDSVRFTCRQCGAVVPVVRSPEDLLGKIVTKPEPEGG